MGEGKYILGDLSRHPLTGESMGPIGGKFKDWLGHAVIAMPFEAHTRLNYTGAPGSVMGIYYSLIFQLGKWEYMVRKADEWVEVSPVHAQYYQLTQKQKEDLEGKIKQGLASVSQSVADMELLMHDKRRYLEFLHYMGYQSIADAIKADKKIEKSHGHEESANMDASDLCFGEDTANEKKDKETLKKAREKRVDNHSLKAVFIDQVDMHTGEGISMRSIVSRWPTLITDFMNMADDDMDPSNVMEKLKVSRAEAVVLITKNKLYQEWKKIFGPEIKSRYIRIQELLGSREKSVEQYREWLKPFIARHKLISEGLGSEAGRRTNRTLQFTTAGTASSGAQIVLYVWKDFLIPEIFKGGSEDMGKLLMEEKRGQMENKIPVDDKWTMKNLIFGKEFGLINDHPWITEKWVKDMKREMFKERWLTKHKPYYTFFVITLERATARMPDGSEIDDGIFDVNFMVLSQNAAFVKMLELKAKQQELEDHINGLIGLKKPVEGSRPKYSEDKDNPVLKFFEDKLNVPLQFAKQGPYERDFDDRITKSYLQRAAGERYVLIVNFLKKKMGMGGG